MISAKFCSIFDKNIMGMKIINQFLEIFRDWRLKEKWRFCPLES